MYGNYTASNEHQENARRPNVTQEKFQVDIGLLKYIDSSNITECLDLPTHSGDHQVLPNNALV